MKSNSSGGLGRYAARYDKPVLNVSSETIPPYAVMRIVAASQSDQDESYWVDKPNGAAKAKYLINGPLPIDAQQPGNATDTYPTLAIWSGVNPPTAAVEWGPVSGSWHLSINGKGFLILGGVSGSTVRVAAIPPAATTGADFPLIRIRNNSGVPLLNRSIVGIGAPIDVPPGSLVTQPAFQSAAPQAGKVFAVLMSDVAFGDVVDAAPLGIVSCSLDYQNASHERCDPVNGDYAKLRSGATGRARIIWRSLGGVAGGGSLGVQAAYVFIESGGSTRIVKHGMVQSGSQISAATGSYLQPVTPGIGPVYEYDSNPSNPLSVNGSTRSGNMVAGENLSFWLTFAPAASAQRKGLIGIRDPETGLTWAVSEPCAAWPIASG